MIKTMKIGKCKNPEKRRSQWDMNKADIIAHRILGWKLNSWDKWV